MLMTCLESRTSFDNNGKPTYLIKLFVYIKKFELNSQKLSLIVILKQCTSKQHQQIYREKQMRQYNNKKKHCHFNLNNSIKSFHCLCCVKNRIFSTFYYFFSRLLSSNCVVCTSIQFPLLKFFTEKMIRYGNYIS